MASEAKVYIEREHECCQDSPFRVYIRNNFYGMDDIQLDNEQEVETIITDLQSALARMRELSDGQNARVEK